MLETCGRCGTRFAVGLPACPHCWAPVAEPGGDDGQGDGDEDEEADVAKITKRGVTFDAEHDPGLAAPVPEEPEAVQDAPAAPEPPVPDVPEPVVTPEPPAPAETPSAPPPAPPLPPKAGE